MPRPLERPTLRLFPTTLWEFPSQHYTTTSPPGKGLEAMQGDKAYAGATPSWVIWQLLQRYTRENDTIVDPMCGSGTTLDVCEDTGRKGLGFDLAPSRPDIRQADARNLPLPAASADFVFIDPPYSTHITYSDSPACIGKLDAAGEDGGAAYYDAMRQVITQAHRVLKDRRYMALYVSDSFRKRKSGPGGVFMPIGFELFAILRESFRPVDIICVVRKNQKLDRGNWRKAAEEGNFYLRGFNYLLIFKKESGNAPPRSRKELR
jgi:DNA modification methylase